MSWDIYMDGEEFETNYTSNVYPMFKDAMGLERSFSETFDKRMGEDILPKIVRGISVMLMQYSSYEELNPANGWGDVDGAIKFLMDIALLCAKHPKKILHVE